MDAGGYGEGLESQAGPVKEKKTRKRLRLSCVECTKRRQKCDRKYPCGLCVSRGVPHLCRWENVPVARPAPARPPTIPETSVAGPSSSSVSDAKDQLIQDLQSKVAALEKQLQEQQRQQPQPISPIAGPSNSNSNSSRMRYSSSSSPSLSGSSPSATRSIALTHITTPSPSPAPLSDRQLELLPMHPPSEAAPDPPDPYLRDPFAGPLCHLGPGTYATTSALAQLCLGHFGEFTGRGSLVCALHFISTGNTPRFLYANSTEPTSSYHPTEMTSHFLINRMDHIINTLPSRTLSTLLARRFFDEANYLFGIPEEWWWKAFGKMWEVLERPGGHGMHVNANFLVLFFAIMAYVPDPGPASPHPGAGEYTRHQSGQDYDYEDLSNRYFIAALEARRVAEDNHLNLPNLSLMVSAADGTVLTCLAIPILATWLSQRGRMSEGWKLVGVGMRSALGVGLHRDPGWGQWAVMSEEEGVLRRRAWWGLWVRDKMFSFLLGRQHMVRSNSFDVQLPSSSLSFSPSPSPSSSSPGSFDPFTLGLEMMISLAKLAGTVIETCFSMQMPPEESYWGLDGELEVWEENLAPVLRWGRGLPEVSSSSSASSPSSSSSAAGPSANHTLHSGFTPRDLSHIRRTRYVLTTWCIWMRIKVWIACLGRPGLGWEMYRDAGRRCVELCLRLGGMQCGVYEGVKGGLGVGAGSGLDEGGRGEMGGGGGGRDGGQPTPASIGHTTYPGPVWFFEGCFSLLESIAILLTMLTRHPWPEKVLEADALARRAIGVLEDVERWQTGREGEVARLGVKVLRTLRREGWWESQVGGGEATRVGREGWEGWEPSLVLGSGVGVGGFGGGGGGAGGGGGGGRGEVDYGMLGGYDALASEVYTNEFGFRNSMFMT